MSGFLRSYEDRGEAAPFLFILNILVPGNPVVATVMYWALEGAGDGEVPSSSPSAGASSRYGTFLKMLERWGLGLRGNGCVRLTNTYLWRRGFCCMLLCVDGAGRRVGRSDQGSRVSVGWTLRRPRPFS